MNSDAYQMTKEYKKKEKKTPVVLASRTTKRLSKFIKNALLSTKLDLKENY